MPAHQLVPEHDARIATLLTLAREQLGLPVAFLGRFDGGDRELRALSASVPLPVAAGFTEPRDQTHCQRIVDGRMPFVVPDVAATPAARVGVPAVEAFGVAAFAGVPVNRPNGELYGTLCCIGFERHEDLQPRDVGVLRVLASAIGALVDDEEQERESKRVVLDRLAPVLAAGGPDLVFQPIFDLTTMAVVGAEALSRFPAVPVQGVEQWFRDAAAVGAAVDLDLAVLRSATRRLPRLGGGYVSVNLNPATAAAEEFAALAVSLPMSRIVVEITEHDAVADYGALARALRPLRDAGLRVAVDDAGAGYASMRHILALVPDIIKIDRSLVASIDHDTSREALVVALVAFAAKTGADLVAEGVETPAEMAALRGVGVRLGQGFHLARPAPLPVADHHPVAAVR
jgi:EAL domain-containing protein (putative c-di-GMP-specific phosphodiesterase class I)